MEAVRAIWTDERLDDLNRKVDRVEQRVDGLQHEMQAEFRAVRVELKSEFQAVRGEMNARFDALEARMDRLQVTMIGTMGTILVAFASLFFAQL